MIYLRSVEKRPNARTDGRYPLSFSLLGGLDRLALSSSVTILCGENGSGKTTLMHLLAAGIRAYPVGLSGAQADKARLFGQAAGQFRFIMAERPRHSFFFTAEDFSRYLDERRAMADEARAALQQIDAQYSGRSALAKSLAALPHQSTLNEMAGQYGRDLLRSSHGEGFLSFFESRLVQGGLYLMDEPEGALSYANQLSLMALMGRAIAARGQIVMATHSPVLAAYPGARLMEVSPEGVEPVDYGQLSGVQFLTHFMRHRQAILKDIGLEDQEDREIT